MVNSWLGAFRGGQNGVEKSEGVAQISLDSVADFSQRWQGASFISWSSSGYPKCHIAPGGVSEKNFLEDSVVAHAALGCSTLPPSPLRFTMSTRACTGVHTAHQLNL